MQTKTKSQKDSAQKKTVRELTALRTKPSDKKAALGCRCCRCCRCW